MSVNTRSPHRGCANDTVTVFSKLASCLGELGVCALWLDVRLPKDITSSDISERSGDPIIRQVSNGLLVGEAICLVHCYNILRQVDRKSSLVCSFGDDC